MKIFLIYLLLMNIAGFAAMELTSVRPRHTHGASRRRHYWAQPAGRSAGTWAGMYAFRHKTKHWYFVKGMPLIFFIHVVIACVIYRNFY